MADQNIQNNLLEHLRQLVRERDPYMASGGHFFVKQYIRQTLTQWGNVTTHDFEYQGRQHQNLLLNLPARQPKSQDLILIAAHYDGVPGSPAADDNATGVAVLLELARMIQSQPLAYPVQLVAFDLEEYGLIGSRAYAKQLKSQNRGIRLMLSLEMLGYYDASPNSQKYPAGLELIYPDTGDFIALVGNFRTLLDLWQMSDAIRRTGTKCEWLPSPNRGLWVPQTRLSDHAPFWDEGYPAVMVTDTAFLRNPHYHQPSDRLETINLDFLSGVCTGLGAALAGL